MVQMFLLGSRLPLVQSPMAGVQDFRLALAVCRRGGGGSIPCGMLDEAAVRREVASMRQGLADSAIPNAPFALNFFCHDEPIGGRDLARDARWSRSLKPFYDERAVDMSTITPGARRRPFSTEMANAVCELAPPIVSFHYGLPRDNLAHQLKLANPDMKIMSSATTLGEGIYLASSGVVDVIVAQGIEAGGHRGIFLSASGGEGSARPQDFTRRDMMSQMPTILLVEKLVAAMKGARALAPVAIIAAGGVSSPDGVARCMQNGACGVQVGTAFLCCNESTASAFHRRAACDVSRGTVVTKLFTGRPARAVSTYFTRALNEADLEAEEGIPLFPFAGDVSLPLRRAAESGVWRR